MHYVNKCPHKEVRVCVHVCVCVRHGTQLRCKKWSNEPAPSFGYSVSSISTCDHSDPLWHCYLLLSDYWPSCYLLYTEATLISSSPPLPELKGQFTCNSSNPQSGFYWICYILTFIYFCGQIILWVCGNVISVLVFLNTVLQLVKSKGVTAPALIVRSSSTDIRTRPVDVFQNKQQRLEESPHQNSLTACDM